MKNKQVKLFSGIGGIFERKIAAHSGFETGIYYRKLKAEYRTIDSDTLFSTKTSAIHLSIPILYKYYSRILILSAGPTFNFFPGKELNNPFLTTKSYNIESKIYIGLVAKASKSIRLTQRFILEPELRFNAVFTRNLNNVGFGIAAKYKL